METGLEIPDTFSAFQNRNMGMPRKPYIPRITDRQPGFIQMTVGKNKPDSFRLKEGIIAHHRKIQEHLIHFAVAITPDCQNSAAQGIQEFNHFLGDYTLRGGDFSGRGRVCLPEETTCQNLPCYKYPEPVSGLELFHVYLIEPLFSFHYILSFRGVSRIL